MHIELEKINFKTHPLVRRADDVRNLISPLYATSKITHFCYTKKSKENGRMMEATLHTHPSFCTDIFYPHRFYEHAFNGDIDSYENGAYLWPSLNSNEVFKAAFEHMKCRHILTIVNALKDGYEIFFFASDEKNPLINQVLMSRLYSFYEFIFEFKEKACDLLKEIDDNRIVFPSNTGDSILLPAQEYLRKYNYKNSANRLTKTLLSSREKQCAHYILQGLTSKEIAKLLAISHRTVEIYIERLKKRINCKNKAELIKTLLTINASH